MEPSLEDIIALSKEGSYDICPVCRRIGTDGLTPVEVVKRLMNVSSHCYLLESAEEDKTWGRYSFLGYDPKLSITCNDGHMVVGDLKIDTDDPAKYIRQVLEEHRSPKIDGMPTFTGGLVGYFSYDYLKYSEKSLDLDAQDTEGFRDVDLMLFDRVMAFDNVDGTIVLIANVDLRDPEVSYNKAVLEIDGMERLVTEGRPRKGLTGRMTSDIRAMFDRDRFCSMVEEAKRHIFEGDIFQVVLSNRLEADFEGSLLPTYSILRESNPSPYMFYFSGSDMEVAGASPETLIKLEWDVLHTFPLAGTRPRGRTEEEDLRLERELLSDEKELAEHNMLVDLGRNDLGRISEFGSVEVERYHCIQRFSHVMHIGSTVRGTIREGADALDAIDSVLPAGTLSGAPKIMACRIINELEDNKRGIYGGAIGYIDFSGNLDTAIAIRIAYKKNGKVFVRSGAGIVADSVPENEYQECINKAAAVVQALKKAEEADP
ncbi:MAG: anthranilate synthase component I family protein [Candidatus Methanomethylophilaceae archaeon]|nr:anthranilate synthase component I family protein [Candidatus Methanomethylophilaceae archaeon]